MKESEGYIFSTDDGDGSDGGDGGDGSDGGDDDGSEGDGSDGDGDPVTGIDNGNNPEFILSIYPMPSPGNRISVLLRSPKTEPVLIEIIDALGRLHFSQVVDSQTLMHGAELVPPASLYNGIYFLRATQADIRARKKIIIKN